MSVRRLQLSDNLKSIAEQCVSKKWGDDAELLDYSETSLRSFLEDSDNILVAHYSNEVEINGLGLGYILRHPSGNATLYIDELDVLSDYRRQGIARTLMVFFRQFAKDLECSEVWLSARKGNLPAEKLYDSLQPTERKDATIFGYDIRTKQ